MRKITKHIYVLHKKNVQISKGDKIPKPLTSHASDYYKINLDPSMVFKP